MWAIRTKPFNCDTYTYICNSWFRKKKKIIYSSDFLRVSIIFFNVIPVSSVNAVIGTHNINSHNIINDTTTIWMCICEYMCLCAVHTWSEKPVLFSQCNNHLVQNIVKVCDDEHFEISAISSKQIWSIWNIISFVSEHLLHTVSTYIDKYDFVPSYIIITTLFINYCTLGRITHS